MTQAVTTTEIQALEDYTINTIGIPQEVLIERAALAVQEVIGASNFNLDHILVLAGLGNNGADGVALARLLHNQGLSVSLQFVGNFRKAKPAAQKQLAIAELCGLHQSEKSDFKQATLIVDAIFGTGLNNSIPEGLQKLMKAANHIANDVIAVDVPTGIDATTGEIKGAALKAHTTVTFNYPKVGLTNNQGRKYGGNIITKDIGILCPANFLFGAEPS